VTVHVRVLGGQVMAYEGPVAAMYPAPPHDHDD
jgi:hypothetical protein